MATVVTGTLGEVGKVQNQTAPGPKPTLRDRIPMLFLADLKGFKSVMHWRSSTSPAARARSSSSATDILPPASASLKKPSICEARIPRVAPFWSMSESNLFDGPGKVLRLTTRGGNVPNMLKCDRAARSSFALRPPAGSAYRSAAVVCETGRRSDQHSRF